jgi:hypothetical protein
MKFAKNERLEELGIGEVVLPPWIGNRRWALLTALRGRLCSLSIQWGDL